MRKFFLWLSLLFDFCLQAGHNGFFSNGYSTHQPVLYAVAKATKGPIIEFGCGNGSTDLLHELCERDGRILITLEDDLDWLNRFASKYEGRGYNRDNSGWHKFFHVPGRNQKDPENPSYWVEFLNTFELLDQLFFDVCFIDQSPWLARFETIKKMKNRSRFLVIHDIDYFPMHHIFGTVIEPIQNQKEGRFDFQDVFSYFKVYFPQKPWPDLTGPPTLLGSDFDPYFPTVDFSKEIAIDSNP